MKKDQLLGRIIFFGLLLILGWSYFMTCDDEVFLSHEGQVKKARSYQIYKRKPKGIMGTQSQLILVLSPEQDIDSARVFDEAEARIRSIEARFSAWINASELSRFNAIGKMQPFQASAELIRLLRSSKRAFEETKGGFDITCRPLIELWKQAGKEGHLPTETEIQKVRMESHWSYLTIQDDTLIKSKDTVRIDMGGIAKGYAIDEALTILEASGACGGMVDIGGDLAVFGVPAEDERWKIEILDPFKQTILGSIFIESGAVCTSGDYARFSMIDGKRYSHIIDPRTGYPVDQVPSVTVVAPKAMLADYWATALSVLSDSGEPLRAKGVEFYLIHQDKSVLVTSGFPEVIK